MSRVVLRSRVSGKLVAGAAVLIASMGSHFRTPLLPAIGDELTLTAASLGLISTAFGVGRLATDLPAGFMSDRLAPHRIFAIAGVLLAVGSGVFAMADVPSWVLAAALALGIASAMANTAGVTYFLTGTTSQRRGRAMAGFSAALLTGQAIGPTVAGLLANLGTWRTAMWGAGVLGVLLMVGGAVAARRTPQPGTNGMRSGEVATGEGPRSGHDPTDEGPTGMTLGERWALYGVGFAMMFTIGAMPQTLVPIIGGDALGLTVATIGAALGIGGVARFVATLLGGWLSDRFPRKLVLIVGLAVYGFGVALLAVEGSRALWLASIIVMSLSSFGIATASAMIGDRVPAGRTGREIGAFRFTGDVGLVIGPLLTTLVLQHVGQAPAVLLVAAVVAASVVALAALVPTRPGGARDERVGAGDRG